MTAMRLDAGAATEPPKSRTAPTTVTNRGGKASRRAGRGDAARGRARRTRLDREGVCVAVCDGLTDVSTEARRLAAVASVLGAALSIDDAGEVLGEPVGRLLPWIAEIVDAGIVVAEAQAFAFVDDATREAIYARIPERERLPLHRQIGSFLLARGGSAIPAAGHLASAARFGDQAAL